MNQRDRLIFLATLAVAVAACTKKHEEETPEGIVPPELEIQEFRAPGGLSGEPGGCVELGTDADETITVVVRAKKQDDEQSEDGATALGDWSLRPPGTCGGAPDCGHLIAQVDPADSALGTPYALQATAATRAIALPFARPCPSEADSTECVGFDDPLGDHTIVIGLRDDDGIVTLARVSAEIHIAARGECPRESSTGGAGGAAGAGGAPNVSEPAPGGAAGAAGAPSMTEPAPGGSAGARS